jgi:hypothetical protein
MKAKYQQLYKQAPFLPCAYFINFSLFVAICGSLSCHYFSHFLTFRYPFLTHFQMPAWAHAGPTTSVAPSSIDSLPHLPMP